MQLEARLRGAQKMEALGTLAGGVAHQFNNIFATIMGNVELMRQDLGPAHMALESLEEIRKAGARGMDLVQQVLAFGRRLALERKVMSLAPVVQESARQIRATLPDAVRLEVECVDGAPSVLADPTQIQQILLKLYSNAWQALQGQGRPGLIEVRLRPLVVDAAPYTGVERRSWSERAQLRPGHYSCLEVRDNGNGMDQATKERIFEPFFSTRPVSEGAGLGLSVVLGIVQAHEASIDVQSAWGEGTTVRIYLPAADQAAREPAAQQGAYPIKQTRGETQSGEGKGKHVLYIDDDEPLVWLVKRLLERRGYRVSGYTSASEALLAVRADPGDFDLVITDFNMPGMSGLDVATALQELRPDLPVALASAYVTEMVCAQAAISGVCEVIRKSHTVEELCDAVARVAGAKGRASAAA